MTIKLSKHAGGGELYTPAMLEYDGSSYFHIESVSTAGTGLTIVCKFNIGPQTVGQTIGYENKTSLGSILFYIKPSTDGDEPNRLWLRVQDLSNVVICQLISDIEVTDLADHTVFFEYDNVGTASLIIDGNDADDLSSANRILIAGTLPVSASRDFAVGANTSGGSLVIGNIGFYGLTISTGFSWTDFFDIHGNIREFDFSAWLIGNPHGDVEDNRGTGGDMTRDGRIVVSDLGNTGHPILGINTIGDAIAADLTLDKVAWVDGKEITGTLVAAPTPAMPSIIQEYEFKGKTTSYISGLFNYPASISAGELLMLICSNDDAGAGVGMYMTTSSAEGWTRLFEYGDGATDNHMGIFFKVAVGDESVSDTFQVHYPGSTGSAGFVSNLYRIENFNTTAPLGYFRVFYVSSAATHPAYGMTPWVDNTLFFAAISFDGGDGHPIVGTGTGWTQGYQGQSGTGSSYSSMSVMTKEIITPAYSENVTFDQAGNVDGSVTTQFWVNPG